MKTKTILKAIGFFIGWLLSFQLIGVGTYLMNQPSNLSFTFGVLAALSTIGAIGYFAWNLGGYMGKLSKEYLESKEVKQEEPEQEVEEEVKQDKQE
jgi:NhaP-type Na+/H+ or K+/H+ antiporter